MKRSQLLFVVFIASFVVEMVFYGLDRLNIFTNFIWIFATFTLLSVFIVFLRQKMKERAETIVDGFFEEHQTKEEDRIEEKNKP